MSRPKQKKSGSRPRRRKPRGSRPVPLPTQLPRRELTAEEIKAMEEDEDEQLLIDLGSGPGPRKEPVIIGPIVKMDQHGPRIGPDGWALEPDELSWMFDIEDDANGHQARALYSDKQFKAWLDRALDLYTAHHNKGALNPGGGSNESTDNS